MKRTFYDILGVARTASDEEIEAAFRQGLLRLESDGSGLNHGDAALASNLLKQAYWTLSDNMRRAAYDASLAAPIPDMPEIKVRVRREPRLVPGRLLVTTIGGLLAFIILSQLALSFVNRERAIDAAALAQKKTEFREYEMSNGVSSPGEIAAHARREEERRQEADRRREEDARRELEHRQARELDESRRYAASVSRDLRDAEEQARRAAEYEKARAEEEERARREREQYRQDEQRRMWQRQLKN